MWLSRRGPHGHGTELPVCRESMQSDGRPPRGGPGTPATSDWSDKWFSSHREFEMVSRGLYGKQMQ